MRSFVSLKTGLMTALAGVLLLTAACEEQKGDTAQSGPKVISREEASSRLTKLLKDVQSRAEPVGSAEAVATAPAETAPKLPPVDSFPLTVDPGVVSGATVTEIFASTEKSGKGTDGWMVEAVTKFNASNHRLSDGSTARIALRSIASGTAYDLIAWGQGKPAGFTPSNELWVRMAEARGVKTQLISPRLVGNTAGIVMKEDMAKRIEDERGSVGIAEVVDDVVQGKAVAGYTDPFASSTGLNFLVSVLEQFANKNEAKLLSPDVTAALEAFQKNIPFIAQTTMQMRDSVANDGSLDTFVMERQTFVNTDSLKSGYRFVPFGVRHDNPLYALESATPAQIETMEAFAGFAAGSEMQKLAQSYGFEEGEPWASAFPVPSGQTLIEAQKIWKQKKDAGKRIVAVFLADLSGSMEGPRITNLKAALEAGVTAISPKNSIGLVVFSSDVRTVLEPAPFTFLQKARFLKAVDEMSVGGGTAMFDGIAVSLRVLEEELKKDPNAKPMLFVLTDGETNEGHVFDDLAPIVRGMRIPVHTIGFEADLKVLGQVSNLVEAASIKAGVDDVAYKISAMLNSQM
nr:VWA domain-containing protein [uncultured Dongia sp.]